MRNTQPAYIIAAFAKSLAIPGKRQLLCVVVLLGRVWTPKAISKLMR